MHQDLNQWLTKVDALITCLCQKKKNNFDKFDDVMMIWPMSQVGAYPWHYEKWFKNNFPNTFFIDSRYLEKNDKNVATQIPSMTSSWHHNIFTVERFYSCNPFFFYNNSSQIDKSDQKSAFDQNYVKASNVNICHKKWFVTYG